MKNEVLVWNVGKIMQLIRAKKIHPNPIGQRLAVTEGTSKSVAIVKAFLMGYGIGMITIRDIREDAEMQKVYPGYDYLVIDGGHRIRALAEFQEGRFKINGKTYGQVADEFDSYNVPFAVVVCSSLQAIEIFRNVNMTTSVNPIEMIMCDDQSLICQAVRSRTYYYKEYNNKPHPLFDASLNINNVHLIVPEHFTGPANPRREWDKYVFVAIHKVLGKGNVDAGEGVTTKMIESEYEGINPVSKTVLGIVDRFFDDVLAFKNALGVKLNKDNYAAFQTVWFELYSQNQNFKITDIYKFRDEFMHAYTLLTGTKDTTYNNSTFVWEGESINVKEFVRKNVKNFANGKVQDQCAKMLINEMGNDFGVVFRDAKRSISRDERAEALALQKYRCAIDGEPLALEDSVWGHDTPWAKGGRLEDGAVIRRNHNIDMGSLTLDEYRHILAMRKQAA